MELESETWGRMTEGCSVLEEHQAPLPSPRLFPQSVPQPVVEVTFLEGLMAPKSSHCGDELFTPRRCPNAVNSGVTSIPQSSLAAGPTETQAHLHPVETAPHPGGSGFLPT